MVSTYEYTSLATIENLMGLDLSAVNSVALSDARVEAMITSAEQIINGYLGTTTDITTTDGIATCANLITIKLINAKLIMLGHQDLTYAAVDFTNLSIIDILKLFLHEAQDDFVESIPMSGASYYNPDNRSFL